MLLSGKQSVGIEIARDAVRLAQVEGRLHNPVVKGLTESRLAAGTVRFSPREPNVQNQAAFVAAVRDVHLRSLSRSTRVSVSVPDAVGRIYLLDLDTRIRSREEGLDIIRWKLKKTSSIDPNDLHLDYQVLKEKDTGEVSVLVGGMGRDIITQYEDLLVEAGIQPYAIDFSIFNLYSLCASRLEVSDNYVFICFHAGSLALLAFSDRVTSFFRGKELSDLPDPTRLYQEINSSLLVLREKSPELETGEIFLFCDPQHVGVVQDVAAAAAGKDITLASPVSSLAATAVSDLFTYAGAVGAAMRGL